MLHYPMTQTALITGATGGIGYELAKCCAEHGIDLVLVGRSPEKLAKVKEQLVTDNDISATTIQVDLSSSDAPSMIADHLKKQKITVTHLINNAGFGDFGPFIQTEWAKEEAMMQVNMQAVVHLTKLIIPGMVERGSGRVLNLASTAAFQPGPWMAVYYATKSFVLSFSEALSYELKDTGVTVTALCPGPTRSGFQKQAHIEDSKLVKDRALPTAAEVARYGFDAMISGRPVAIHGFMNKIMARLVGLLPRRMVVSIVAGMQEKKG